MSKLTFCEGLDVYYNGHFGKIRFICNNYMTICIQSFDEKVRDVCMLVYPDNYKLVTLAKESCK